MKVPNKTMGPGEMVASLEKLGLRVTSDSLPVLYSSFQWSKCETSSFSKHLCVTQKCILLLVEERIFIS